MAQLDGHLARQSFTAALHLVHSLKGSAGQLGEADLQALARTVEIQLRRNETPVSSDLLALSGALAATLERTKVWLQAQPENTLSLPKMTLHSELLPRFRDLYDLLKAVDGQSLMLAESLARDLPGSLSEDLRKDFLAVLNAIRRFDLEGAAAMMQGLLPQLEAGLS